MVIKLLSNIKILSAMKKLLGTLLLSALISVVYGQRSIDALFEKYADKDGFVTLNFSGNLLNFICSDKDKSKENHWPGKVTEVRMLFQDNDKMKVENFYDAAMRDLNKNDYEEFMRVKESDQDLRMLVRTNGDIINEFLLIAGGEDNFIIQVKGKMTFKEAEDFSAEMRKEHGKEILSDLD